MSEDDLREALVNIVKSGARSVKGIFMEEGDLRLGAHGLAEAARPASSDVLNLIQETFLKEFGLTLLPKDMYEDFYTLTDKGREYLRNLERGFSYND